MKEATQHLEFCCELYRFQVSNGRHFLHEHPWSAISWQVRCIDELLHDEETILVKTDLCRFGMVTTDEEGVGSAQVS